MTAGRKRTEIYTQIRDVAYDLTHRHKGIRDVLFGLKHAETHRLITAQRIVDEFKKAFGAKIDKDTSIEFLPLLIDPAPDDAVCHDIVIRVLDEPEHLKNLRVRVLYYKDKNRIQFLSCIRLPDPEKEWVVAPEYR